MSRAYDDIIGLPHHVSTSRPHMPVPDRAAQFAPFAALSGFGTAVGEAARLTEDKRELHGDAEADVDARLSMVRAHLEDQPQVSITYFQPDRKKDGGAYVVATGCIRKFDDCGRSIVMLDGREVPIDDIVGIDGTLLEFIDWRNGISD